MHGLANIDDFEGNIPDPQDEADFDLPDTQALFDTFISNLFETAHAEYNGLFVLLDSLPDPSSGSSAKLITAAEAKEKGLIPERK